MHNVKTLIDCDPGNPDITKISILVWRNRDLVGIEVHSPNPLSRSRQLRLKSVRIIFKVNPTSIKAQIYDRYQGLITLDLRMIALSLC